MQSGIATIAKGATADKGRWSPVARQDTLDLIDSKLRNKPHEQARVRDSAVSILSKCVSPSTPEGNSTGLVVGYVQSGKTLSFTAVASLARENQYQIVIVITGTSEPLFIQSRDRLRKDLRIGEVRKWAFYENPKQDQADKFRSLLSSWRDAEMPEPLKQTALITVMKHHKHLEHLRKLFEEIGQRHLVGIPILIIDDEADQASLNTKVKKRQESTTYARIMELRRTLPHHSFLQYTATPQAPLLISLIDTLSPSFVEVLEPGEGYVGGKELFCEENRAHVSIIPISDLPQQAGPVSEPPQSLVNALRLFFVGTAASLMESGGATGHRSMLVHPSRETTGHSQFETWVKQIKRNWEQIFTDRDSKDYKDMMEDFETAYRNIRQTRPNLPAFDNLKSYLKWAVEQTVVEVVNAKPGKTPEVKWGNHYGWILIGGQAMDRGFTVEGLTVTYMPRPIGVGNADTLQQRGRFFGYKADYLGYCRVFLESDVFDAFVNYVEHEESVRSELKPYQRNGKPLTDWKRAFLLDPSLSPTRRQVLSLDYIRDGLGNDWFSPQYPAYERIMADSNRKLVDGFVSSIRQQLKPDRGTENRTETQRHLYTDELSLNDVYEKLLIGLKYNASDSVKATGVHLQLRSIMERAAKDNVIENVSVYLMSSGKVRDRSVEETVVGNEQIVTGKIINLFQGANPKDGSIYPGDTKIHNSQNISIQIHRLSLAAKKSRTPLGQDVPVVAIWVPERLCKYWLAQ